MTTTKPQTEIVGYPTEATAQEVDKKYNPQIWDYTLENLEKAYKADCPTLYGYSKKFGRKSAAAWILMQLTAIYGTSSNKDQTAAQSMVSFAEAFAPQVKGYKLTELMIFFARYRTGKYDNSYYSFDSRRIGNAFFNGFLPERNLELSKIMRAEGQAEVEKRRFEPPKGYTSYTLYQKMKELARGGSDEAREYLSGRLTMTTEQLERFLEGK